MADRPEDKFEELEPTGPQPELEITITETDDDEQEGPSRRRPRPGPPQGLMVANPTDEYLIPRKRGGLTFYDLGTRFQSGPPGYFATSRILEVFDLPNPINPNDEWENGYVEIRYEGKLAVILSYDGGQNGISPESSSFENDDDWFALTQALLGSRIPAYATGLDPFGESPANQSGRQLPNCLQLPYKARSFRLVVTAGEKEYEIIEGGGDWKEVRPKHEGELWSSVNTYDETAFNQGEAKAQGKASRLKVTSAHFYEEFDTADLARYKVTSEPSFEADAVEFDVPVKGLHVYLVPQMLTWTLGTWAETQDHKWTHESAGLAGTVNMHVQGQGGWHGQRLPIVPYARALSTPDDVWDARSPYPGGGYYNIATSVETRYLRACQQALARRRIQDDRAFFWANINGHTTPQLTADQYLIGIGENLRQKGRFVAFDLAFDFITASGWHEWDADIMTYEEDFDAITANRILYQPAGVLLGAFKSGEDVYYVWRASRLDRLTDGGAGYGVIVKAF